jgi:signal transduction histidine kinase
MGVLSDSRRFLRSKSGRILLLYLGFCAVLSGVIGAGFYYSNLRWFKEHKSQEKVTALQLVDAFVTDYAAVRSRFGAEAPVPATFRAHSIERFNAQRESDTDFRLRWVGRPGREIATPPADREMADTIEAFAAQSSPKPKSEFLSVNGELMFRTVYPSLAREQSCVSCHNKLQPDKTQWQLNDVMGAFAIDVPVAAFLSSNLLQSGGLGMGLFLALALVGLAIAILSFRRVVEREAAAADLGRRVEQRTAELRAAQEELLRQERLSTLGKVTATVAHELRNPLSAISNTLFAIKEAVRHGVTDLERPIARVERSVRRCDRIITDLLDYTRQREIHRVPTAIDQWLAEVLDEQPIPRGVVLARKLDAPGCHVSFDPDQMRRVVINLVENATQALPDADQSSQQRRIMVGTSVMQNQVELAVEDTGCGIPSDILPKVFEPLFTTKSIGTGLGLPAVKQIVEQHGGSIEIGSTPGVGTRVVVRLPIITAAQMAA